MLANSSTADGSDDAWDPRAGITVDGKGLSVGGWRANNVVAWRQCADPLLDVLRVARVSTVSSDATALSVVHLRLSLWRCHRWVKRKHSH